MKRGVVIYKNGDRRAINAAMSSGCKVYVRRLTMEENICIFEGTTISVWLTKLGIIMAEFKSFHERRKRKRARAR